MGRHGFSVKMIKSILLDIEGTTTPIDFVHKTLFPFARKRTLDFVRENFASLGEEIRALGNEYRQDAAKEENLPLFDENSVEAIAAYLRFLIDIDRKSTPLKFIQGKIWQKGYDSGELKSEMFDDVPSAFKRWYEKKIDIAIYSSGSVLAQKLLFRYTNEGDLTGFISNYFDTNIGGKKQPESYRKIASVKSFPPVENLLFISDAVEELDAARKAGFQTLLSVREGNPPVKGEIKHKIIYTFDGVE